MEKWNRLLVFLASLLLLILFVWVLVHLAMAIQHTLLIFTLGALIAYALSPLVDFVQRLWPFAPADGDRRRGLRIRRQGEPPSHHSRSPAIAIVFVAIALIVCVGIYALGRSFTHEIAVFRDPVQRLAFRAEVGRFLGRVDIAAGHVGWHVNLPGYVARPGSIPQSFRDAGGNAERRALPVLLGIGTAIVESAIVLLISLYLLIYASEMRRLFNAKLPGSVLKHADVWEEDINRILGGFVRGQLTIALIMGVCASLVCLAVGLKLWLLLGVFATVASLVPVFGAYIGAIPPAILALIGPVRGVFHGDNVVAAVVVVVLFVVLNEIASKILYPRLVGKAIGLHEVLVLFVLFAGLEIGRVVGVLLAAPLTAVVLVTVVHLYRLWQDLPETLIAPVVRLDSD